MVHVAGDARRRASLRNSSWRGLTSAATWWRRFRLRMKHPIESARDNPSRSGYKPPQPMTRRLLMKTLFANLLISAAMLNFSAQAKDPSLAPDLVIINASIHTMDKARPTAGAVAILGNRIAAIGSTPDIRALAGPNTRLIDAGEKVVLPGFNDAHVHFLTGGFSLSSVDLRDAKSPEEMARRLAEFAKKQPKGGWILGGDWDHEKWPGAPLPTREMIDAATPENPVFVNRLDGHMALANSFALKLAGVTKETKEPAGGVIGRDKK